MVFVSPLSSNAKGESSLVATIMWLVCGHSHLKEGKLLFVFPKKHRHKMCRYLLYQDSYCIAEQVVECKVHYHGILKIQCLYSTYA